LTTQGNLMQMQVIRETGQMLMRDLSHTEKATAWRRVLQPLVYSVEGCERATTNSAADATTGRNGKRE
jgi:hypothetical protein